VSRGASGPEVRIVKSVTHFDAASAEPPHPAARAALLAAFDEG